MTISNKLPLLLTMKNSKLKRKIESKTKMQNVLRSKFTKQANQLENVLMKPDTTQHIRFVWELLVEKFHALESADKELRDILAVNEMSPNDLSVYFDCCESFTKRFLYLKIRYDAYRQSIIARKKEPHGEDSVGYDVESKYL